MPPLLVSHATVYRPVAGGALKLVTLSSRASRISAYSLGKLLTRQDQNSTDTRNRTTSTPRRDGMFDDILQRYGSDPGETPVPTVKFDPGSAPTIHCHPSLRPPNLASPDDVTA